MKEDFVSYETAVRLKNNGFDWECIATYNLASKNFEIEEIYQNWSAEWRSYVSAPTLQMAMKWLRTKYNINPVPYALSLGWAFDVFDLSDRDISGCKKMYSMDFPAKSACYDTYEQACEASINYVLENYIENGKQTKQNS